MVKIKKDTYFSSIEWTEKDGTKLSIQTQLYQASGLYLSITINGKHEQSAANPFRFAKDQKKHIAQMQRDGIEFSTGFEKTVTLDKDGFFINV